MGRLVRLQVVLFTALLALNCGDDSNDVIVIGAGGNAAAGTPGSGGVGQSGGSVSDPSGGSSGVPAVGGGAGSDSGGSAGSSAVAGQGGVAGTAGGSEGAGGTTPTVSSCCYVHDEPGCDNPTLENCVCQSNNICCDDTWNSYCVQLATLFTCSALSNCPPPGTGGSGGAGGSGGVGGAGGSGGASGGSGGSGGGTVDDFLEKAGPKLSVSGHVCAIWGTTLKCWGDNEHRQLAYNGPNALMPVVVPGEWAAVAAGSQFTCGIKTDLSLWCWGYNQYGRLGRGTTTATSSETPTKVGTASYFRVAASDSNACGLRTDGTIWCWGYGDHRLLGTDQPDTGTPVQVGVGTTFQMLDMAIAQATAITTAGTLWTWGWNSSSYRTAFAYPSSANPLSVTQASPAGYYWMIRNGSSPLRVSSWNNPPVSDPSIPSSVIEIEAGYVPGNRATCVITTSGDLLCHGTNQYGEAGDGKWTSDSIADSIVPWAPILGPQGNWTDVERPSLTGCARDSDDVVWCWGYNYDGELGDGTTVNRSIPWPVGEPAPPVSCEDGIANGTETIVDCGGPDCPACPTCGDGIANGDETGIDCGGPTCAARCPAGQGCETAADCGCTSAVPGACADACPVDVCEPWCLDVDGDGFGNSGDSCLSTDCDDGDSDWHVRCWVRDLFSGVPGTATVTATIEKDDQKCPVVYPGFCLAQYEPPCFEADSTQAVTLDLTLNPDGSLVIEAPVHDTCGPMQVGTVVDVNGVPTGEQVATSYPVPMPAKIVYYSPTQTDQCRVDQFNNDINIQNDLLVSLPGEDIWIQQDCLTLYTVWPLGEPVTLFDIRRWTTKVKPQ
jgi:Regulator of chromosome condensation (RCC1) repeat